jgi:hypothetical protein
LQGYIVIMVFLVIAAVSVGYSINVAGKRRKGLAQWALKNDLTFSAGHDSDFGLRYPDFNCLNRGDSRCA